MAFGVMNTRRYVLVIGTAASLFINCVSLYWSMWSVLTMCATIRPRIPAVRRSTDARGSTVSDAS